MGKPSTFSVRRCLFFFLLLGTVAWGETVSTTVLTPVSFRGHGYLVRTVDPKKEDLRLYWKNSSGVLLHDFHGLESEVASHGDKLLFAANAGMFEPDFSPVGLLVQDGNEIAPLNLRDGTGNFYLKPNGVFALTDKGEARVMESSSYQTFLPRVLWATQSGPLLVHEGEVHPDLVAGSSNLMVRSGVGVRKDGRIVFVISRAPVNFYDFAIAFLVRFKCPNALYLDGHISAFHVPGESEKPGEHAFGPMFGLLQKPQSGP
jgi:uncharacterized protein YigE (DUF2233 family)